MSAIMVYVTAADRDEALTIARAVIAERLAACANILPGVTSVFHWDGDIIEDTETVLILKSTPANLDRLTERVKSLHSYDCPCVVALPIEGGNRAFIDWIREETA